MGTLDYVVLVVYFIGMIVIGLVCMRMVKAQEDYFLGGRSFGKLLQTFAAFGAGTGANDPIQVGRTTWTSGLSGIWSVLMWLFVTPFYWITAIWYRRMRHVTLGDWFVERYDSKAFGVAYTAFAICFYVTYLSTMFSAISKVAASIIGYDQVMVWGFAEPVALEYVLVPGIAALVIVYGVLGGLRAAYWTDLIQGICIILLSVILVPYGLNKLAVEHPDETTTQLIEEHGHASAAVTMDGFRIMHKRTPENYFQIFGGPRSGEFPLHYIVSLTLLGLMGIVVQPHFIATGGGSAKSENAARLGLVTGNFLKRLCTIGWALTGLILLALMANNLEAASDPDKVWGIATQVILKPIGLGLVGLMLACLLAALMSSADCYMIITSGLVVRNVYAPYVDANADEKTYLLAGRLASFIVIIGAAVYSWAAMDVFGQFKIALEVAAMFAAPFWIGMYWRRANKWSAFLTILFSATVFFIVPIVAPMIAPDLRTDYRFTLTNNIVTTQVRRSATESDKERRDASIAIWTTANDDFLAARKEYSDAVRAANPSGNATPSAEQLQRVEQAAATLNSARTKIDKLGKRPEPVVAGQAFVDEFKTGGKSIFWTGGVKQIGKVEIAELDRQEQEGRTVITQYQTGDLQGQGRFNLDYLLYQAIGVDLAKLDNATLETLRLPPRLIAPFLVMIVLSFITPQTRKESLDRYYVKMKTPVQPDPQADHDYLEASYSDPSRFDGKKMFPRTNLEIQKPTWQDALGFVACFVVCFIFIGIAVYMAGIGRGF